MYLTMYNDSHKTLINDYCLTKRKLRYVREPKIAIALAEKIPQRHAVLVFEDNRLVAFLTLYEGNNGHSFSNHENNILVQDLSTDYRYLSKGYVKQAVELLPTFIHTHFPTIDQLTLIVNEDPSFTQALCTEAGFKNTGNTSSSIYDSQVFLQLSIKKSSSEENQCT